jgi:phage tail protein X
MQRIALCVLALAAVVLVSGCKDKNKGMAMGPAQSSSLAYEEPATDYYGPGSLNPPARTTPAGNEYTEYEVYTPTDARASSSYSGGYSGSYSSGNTVAVSPPVQQVSQPAPAPAAFSGTRTGGRRHVVTKGETLYSLARNYYAGDMSKWRMIYDANRGTLQNPNMLRVGQELVIP